MSVKFQDDLTADKVRALLAYDPETGEFTRLHNPDMSNAYNAKYANKPAGGINKNGYVNIRIDDVKYVAHRLAWLYMTGEWPALEVTHRNGLPWDNRWSNLREATHAENSRRRDLPQANNTSGHRNVYWVAHLHKWKVIVRMNGVSHHHGVFDSLEEAAEVARQARQEHYGPHAEYAREEDALGCRETA